MTNYNIFLAEDDEGDKKLIQHSLNKTAHNINLTIVNDGEEACNYFKNIMNERTFDIPDLILLDLNLPKISGLNILKNIKNIKQVKSIPIIILTTSNTENDIIESYSNYASGYLVKPFEIKEWERVINSITNYWFETVNLPKGIN